MGADLVITASMGGMVATPYSGAYAASKAASIALAKSLRAELRTVAPAVRIAVLNPGVVATNLIRTSAARLPGGASMSADLVQVSHDFLNQTGVDPDEAVSWALRALGGRHAFGRYLVRMIRSRYSSLPNSQSFAARVHPDRRH